MSAFGRKNGVGGMSPGARPSFGVAKPMKGGSGARPPEPAAPAGGEQFPPIGSDLGPLDSMVPPGKGDAMSRLAERSSAVADTSLQYGS